jgi:serine/threonine-protein kinase RsbW
MADFAAELIAKQDAISALTERAAAFLGQSGVDARAAHHMALVLDELLTNVATYGGAAAAVSVSLTISPDRVTAEVMDGGAMFDPRVARNPDVTAGAQERPLGGLGLLLVQRMTEGLAYERAGDRNRTTFSICRTPAGQGGQEDQEGRGGGNGVD